MDISGDDTASVTNELKAMSGYLWALLDEYRDKKRDLSELQLKAEKAKQRCQHNREERLNRIWTYMQGLSSLGDLIRSGSDSKARNLRYSAYRENYECALRMMRHSLRPKNIRR